MQGIRKRTKATKVKKNVSRSLSDANSSFKSFVSCVEHKRKPERSIFQLGSCEETLLGVKWLVGGGV